MPHPAELLPALAVNPDDPATLSAYADCLTEHGDERGEYLATHLAIERKERVSKARREWVAARKVEWLGELASRMKPKRVRGNRWRESPTQLTLQRGFLNTLVSRAFTTALAEQIRDCPLAPLLSSVQTLDRAGDVFDTDRTMRCVHFDWPARSIGPALRELTLPYRLFDADHWPNSALFPAARNLTSLTVSEINSSQPILTGVYPHLTSLSIGRMMPTNFQ